MDNVPKIGAVVLALLQIGIFAAMKIKAFNLFLKSIPLFDKISSFGNNQMFTVVTIIATEISAAIIVIGLGGYLLHSVIRHNSRR
jgi:hypothetical protein